MSYYYRRLDNIPCRAPCRRYESCGDVYEDSFPSCSCYNRSYHGRGTGCGCKSTTSNNLNQCHDVFITNDRILDRVFDKVVDDMEYYKPIQDLQMAEQKMNDGCGCGPTNNYVIPPCGYNQSPTWNDQKYFRKDYQNNDPATGSVKNKY